MNIFLHLDEIRRMCMEYDSNGQGQVIELMLLDDDY